jgi:hypothetical protein
LQRISYSIESAFYSGADTGDACDNEDGKETRDQRVFDGRGRRVIFRETQKTSFGIASPLFATEIPAAMRPYSMAVAPELSFKKRTAEEALVGPMSDKGDLSLSECTK